MPNNTRKWVGVFLVFVGTACIAASYPTIRILGRPGGRGEFVRLRFELSEATEEHSTGAFLAGIRNLEHATNGALDFNAKDFRKIDYLVMCIILGATCVLYI